MKLPSITIIMRNQSWEGKFPRSLITSDGNDHEIICQFCGRRYGDHERYECLPPIRKNLSEVDCWEYIERVQKLKLGGKAK